MTIGIFSDVHANLPALEAVLTDGVDVEFARVEYDIERAAGAIEAGPLPDAFAEMLRNAG